MINGAHVIIYSKDAEADRAFFRDELKYEFADAGHGWLIFALPPAEVAVHPSETGGRHQLYLMTPDVVAFAEQMKGRGYACSEPAEQPWGTIVTLTLPSGTEFGVYEPKHESPLPGVGT
jgi:predicted enzyme related to lactoylglutathione lyase